MVRRPGASGAEAIQQNAPAEARQFLSQLAARADWPPFTKALVAKLQSLLAGDRNLFLAADPKLNYKDAADLQLLLEKLSF